MLVAIACERSSWPQRATLGDAGADEKTINNTLLAAYEEIARSRHTVPVAGALGMLDKSREVLKVKIEDQRAVRRPRRIARDRKEAPHPFQGGDQAGGRGLAIHGRRGQRLGHRQIHLADDRRDVVRQDAAFAGHHRRRSFQRPAVEADPRGDRGAVNAARSRTSNGSSTNRSAEWRPISSASRSTAPAARPWKASGWPIISIGLPSDEVRTVAYIDNQALADAALIALGCDQIVMHPRAVLGGPGQYQMKTQEIGTTRACSALRLARRKLRSWSLWAAMFNPNLNVYRCQRLGDIDYFCDERIEEPPAAAQQGRERPAVEKGRARHHARPRALR